jgi:hypothetical protein
MGYLTGLENQEYGHRNSSRDTLYPHKVALTSPTSGGRSVGIVRSRTEASKFFMGLIIDSVQKMIHCVAMLRHILLRVKRGGGFVK